MKNAPVTALSKTEGKKKCGPRSSEVVDAVAADPEAGQVRVVWFGVDINNAVVSAEAPDRFPYLVATQPGYLTPSQGSKDGFVVGVEIRDSQGKRIWPNEVKLHTFHDMLVSTEAQADICVHAGHREVWRIVNLSDETHNFHIHQSKFRVLTVYDPHDQLQREAPWALSPDTIHDVFPVPKYGYIEVEIGFGVGSQIDPVGGIRYDRDIPAAKNPAPAQIGRFVFHCHILEHEDGGMMGIIEVLPFASQSTANFQAAPKSSGD